MDYIEELKKIRTLLLEAKNTHAKSPAYKVLAYKSALEDFVEKEYRNFQSDVLGTLDGKRIMEKSEEPIKVDNMLKLRALVDLNSLSEIERKKLILKTKKDGIKAVEMVKSNWGHTDINKTLMEYSSIITKEKNK